MLDIPSSFIASSSFSSLEAKDILRLHSLIQTRWHEKRIQRRMHQRPHTPILAIGISNPQHLQRAMEMKIPVIHIDRHCLALKRVQQRYYRFFYWKNQCTCFLLLALTSLVGPGQRALKYGMKLLNRYEGISKHHVIRGYVVGTSFLVSLIYMRWMRRQYHVIEIEDELFLLRDDVMRGPLRFMVSNWFLYCWTPVNVIRYVSKSVIQAK
ncbi:uncharacterized protein BYT42DRAFT_639450 [Radiomyces spectabilis]|uniref:uncharacterized protein n=1 Tax=Radiomyces spectabilis TaxID=64574 RepID=UPI002220BBDC|nr:uncharacterized protein BYT42DRAFT_639450 [Radiomyces spectabilis]KAI8374334.1 hypothetical protein BYT42DRAFT_639450 [Radiomyces spectabilis]